MIYLTGDCHFRFSKLNVKNFPESKHLTKDDIVIICGDFGIGPWINNEKENRYWLDWLNKRNFTVAFCDGNHENFDTLDALPVDTWHGGKVHFIRPHVIHLMRGQYYEIGQNTFWVFGGARSHDITDGILKPDDPDFRKKRRELDDIGGLYRIDHWTWWEREMPSKEEYEEGLRNLQAHGNQVDYIISHAISGKLQSKYLYEPEQNELSTYFDRISETVDYRRWYFGHYHADMDVDEKHTLLYDNIVRVGAGAADDRAVATETGPEEQSQGWYRR